ncbi:MAG: tetratricopeptide repeat protein [Candidatus Delongbacteria bacterium]|jgi:tetratricopeptide (TPR) repeat protein|nr:tetratricopeptide repeat protein [Candidatus Delongbacteria bacterium]
MQKRTTQLWMYFILIVSLVSFTYLNHFHNPFHFDDFHTIVNNPHIKELSLNKVKSYFTDVSTFSNMPTNQGYRPIVTLSLAIDYFIAGEMNPFYFHLSLFFWFIVQLVFMIFLLRYLLRKVSDFWGISLIVFFTVLWYGLHTANAETINYIIMRGDSLSTMLVVVGLYLYVRFKSKRKYGLYLIPVVLAILTKQTAVMFFPIQFVYVLLFEHEASLYDLFNRKGVFKKAFVKTLPSFLVCLVFGYVVFVMQRDEAMLEISNVEYMITQPWVMLRYFVLFFFPVSLSADTDWQVFQSIFDVRAIVGIVFVVGLLAYAFKTSRQKETRPISFGILWFFLALMPTSSFIALTQVTNDHRMFFPFVGLVLAVSLWLALQYKRHEKKMKGRNVLKSILLLLPVSILVLNAYGTFQRNQVWSSDESLWHDVTVKSPRNPRGLMNYGLVQMQKGNFEKALEYYNKALRLDPDYVYLHVNLGILKDAMGKPNEAEQHFLKAVNYLAHPAPPYYYAKFLKSHGRIDEAINYCKRSITISYSYMQARHLLMDLYFYKQDKKHLNKLIKETLEIMPGDAYAKAVQKKVKTMGQSKLQQLKYTAQHHPTPENYINLSLECYHQGMYEACIEACYNALELNPDYEHAYNNICSAYNQIGEYEKAIEACEKALAINPEYQRAKNNLNHANEMQADEN